MQEEWQLYQKELATRAQLQGIAESMSDKLAEVAREGREFVGGLKAGDVISPAWIATRHKPIERALQALPDV